MSDLLGVAFLAALALPLAYAASSFAAPSPYRCAAGSKLKKRRGGYQCLDKHHRVHAPRCISGYERRRKDRVWSCVKASQSQRLPTPTPTPGASPQDALVLWTFGRAKAYGQSFLGVGVGGSYWYKWSVDAANTDCVVLDSSTVRCWVYLYSQVVTNDNPSFLNYTTRYVYRVGIFGHDVGRGVYEQTSNTADLFAAYAILCTDQPTPNVPGCTPNGPS